MFEQIGSLKYPVVQFSNKNTFKFFNHKYKPITKCYFFGDSNNQNLKLGLPIIEIKSEKDQLAI